MKTAAIIYLYVRIITAGNGGEESRHPFTDWASCQAALRSARVAVSSGGDAENVVAMWCAASQQTRRYAIDDNENGWKPVRGVK